MKLPGITILKPHLNLEYRCLYDSLKYLIIQTMEYVLTTFNVYMSNMLTILRDQDYSMATIYHVMDKIRDTVSLLSRSANI